MNKEIIIAIISASATILAALIASLRSIYSQQKKKNEELELSNKEKNENDIPIIYRLNFINSIRLLAKGFVKVFIPLFIIIIFVISIFQLITIKKITKSISTQYADNFSNNMRSINNLIRETKDSLLILCDVPAYGHFSNPEYYKEYKAILTDKIEPIGKIQIKMISYTRSMRDSLAKDQLKIKTEEDLIKMKNEDKRYKNFFKNWNANLIEPKTVNEFYKILADGHLDMQRILSKANVKLFEAKAAHPIFFWIRDNQEAIFSFYNYGDKPHEVSFKTIDSRLLTIFYEIAQEIEKHSQELKYETLLP